MIDRTWVRAICVLAAGLMAAFGFVGAVPGSGVPLFPPPFDKAAHFVYYAAMALLLVHGVGLRLVLLPLLLVPLVGALDEWHQLSIAGRDASVWDWVADILGAVVAVGGYWRRRKRP